MAKPKATFKPPALPHRVVTRPKPAARPVVKAPAASVPAATVPAATIPVATAAHASTKFGRSAILWVIAVLGGLLGVAGIFLLLRSRGWVRVTREGAEEAKESAEEAAEAAGVDADDPATAPFVRSYMEYIERN